ncbi:hypothetical protein PV08_08463 [Exophiala spinifera]|uniref:Uncharacterized protein n=1 Tax=Exophiala spinifera TaxID=91928 RepID=A0A0D1YDX8_9EURO|nr:uncharacterized protein PV08_08463 [Exophiala spinifera]KIW13276.1 hypothetical protein PV08_08463 [Exophiala spinifera]
MDQMDAPQTTVVSNTTPDQPQATPDNGQEEIGAPEPAPIKPKRHRGRQAKDPLGQTVQFKCNKVEDLEQQLRDYLASPTGDPAHTTLEFSFPVTAAFLVALREKKGNKPVHDKTPYTYSHFNKTAVTVIDALQNIQDPKEQMLAQKGISKTLVDAVQEADGYHYSFHNHWISREDQASRFSYFCNDSVLNKGRAANEGSKFKPGVKVKKQVWECDGVLAIKFSLTKMSLLLHYKHIPLHPTFDERAPLPRAGSKRRKLMEIFHPEKLQHLKRGRPKRATSLSTSRPPAIRSPSHNQDISAPTHQVSNGAAATVTRDSSLQPLFDFLGSAEQATTTPAESVSYQVEHGAESLTIIPQAGRGSDTGVATASEETDVAQGGQLRVAGLMTGAASGEQTIRARRAKGSTKKNKRTATLTGTNSAPAPSAPADSVMDPATELEALRAKLREAEQKIQYLEAERSRAAAPLTWTGSSQSPSTPFHDPAPPPQGSIPDLNPQQHSPHALPPQWQPQHDPYFSASSQNDSLPRSMPPVNPESGPSSYSPSPIRTLPENIPYYGFVPAVRNPHDPPPPRKLQPKPPAV